MIAHRPPEERRRQIAEALMTVIAEEGLDGTTIRRVADTAGVSVGLVQRYFMTKADLLQFGIEHVHAQAQARVQDIVLQLPIQNIVTQLAEAMLPLDEERERETRVWLIFAQSSLYDSGQRTVHQAATDELIDGLHQALDKAQEVGELSKSVDTAEAAATLSALVDGLSLNGLTARHRYEPDVCRAILRNYIALLFASAQ